MLLRRLINLIYDMNKRDLYLCGDIHGEWKELIWTLIRRYDIKNADILILGDFGIGFDKTMPDLYKWAEKKLEDSDLVIRVIRGNHDDPSYFSDEEKYSYPRLRFLEDHKVYNICGREVYAIGGANSTDITDRLETNQKLAARGKDKRIWWPDEGVVEKTEGLPDKVDIIVSHSAPLSFMPVIQKFPETPEWQYEKILEERKYLDYVLKEVNSDYWFYGHYHNHYSGTYGNLLYRGLGIMELFEAPQPVNNNPQGEENEHVEDGDTQ